VRIGFHKPSQTSPVVLVGVCVFCFLVEQLVPNARFKREYTWSSCVLEVTEMCLIHANGCRKATLNNYDEKRP
jgi:hypothetical protein